MIIFRYDYTIWLQYIYFIFFYHAVLRSTERGYTPQYVVCPFVRLSVCLYVTFRHRDHIGWNYSSKMISSPNSVTLMPGLTSTWAI